jgi:hypothetical protein
MCKVDAEYWSEYGVRSCPAEETTLCRYIACIFKPGYTTRLNNRVCRLMGDMISSSFGINRMLKSLSAVRVCSVPQQHHIILTHALTA